MCLQWVFNVFEKGSLKYCLVCEKIQDPLCKQCEIYAAAHLSFPRPENFPVLAIRSNWKTELAGTLWRVLLREITNFDGIPKEYRFKSDLQED